MGNLFVCTLADVEANRGIKKMSRNDFRKQCLHIALFKMFGQKYCTGRLKKTFESPFFALSVPPICTNDRSRGKQWVGHNSWVKITSRIINYSVHVLKFLEKIIPSSMKCGFWHLVSCSKRATYIYTPLHTSKISSGSQLLSQSYFQYH